MSFVDDDRRLSLAGGELAAHCVSRKVPFVVDNVMHSSIGVDATEVLKLRV